MITRNEYRATAVSKEGNKVKCVCVLEKKTEGQKPMRGNEVKRVAGPRGEPSPVIFH